MIASLVLLALLSLAVRADHIITGSIERQHWPLDFSQMSVTLNNGEYSGLVDINGQFAIAVPEFPATYKLQVFDTNNYFEPVVVEISDQPHAAGKFIKAYLFSIKNGKDLRLMYPLVLEPDGRLNYFEDRIPFDPTQYLKNPLVWMVGLMLIFSKMMKSMDKEELKKAQENQQEMLGNMPQNCQQQ